MSVVMQTEFDAANNFLGCGDAVPPLGLGLAALGRPGYINLGHAGDLPAGRFRHYETKHPSYSIGAVVFDDKIIGLI